MFWLRYQKGEMVKDIFRLAGYDPKVLGDGRIYNFSYQLARAMEAGKNLEETPRENSSTHHEHDSRIAALEQEILYLRQQIESLKHALTSPLALELPD